MQKSSTFLAAAALLGAMGASTLPAMAQTATSPSAPPAAAPAPAATPAPTKVKPMHHHRHRHAAKEADPTAGDEAVDRLNEESLQRATNNQNSPGVGTDNTGALNQSSDSDAMHNKSMPTPPRPFH